jgi:acylphosphatase
MMREKGEEKKFQERKGRISITVRGIVQGVFFRAHTKQVADALNLTGWVRNEYDGSVTIVAEGPEEKLKELLSWCKKGPSGARVEIVEEQWEDARGEWEEFEIR